MAGLFLVASWGVWDWKRAACRFRVSGEVPRAYLGKKNTLGIYFARVYFHRFIRQLKNVFYGKFRCGTPAGKTSQERQAQACQEIQGRKRISSEVELVSVEQKEENIQCKKRESGYPASLFHSDADAAFPSFLFLAA